MTAAELAEKLEALLALREKAALATTNPFQPADTCWSIAEYCGETEDLVANSMSFNVAKFFSEVSNQSPDLLRQAAARLRSMEEALRGWQDISTAPEDGQRIIALGPEPGIDGLVRARETRWSFYQEGSIACALYRDGKGPSGDWYWEEPIHSWVSSWKPTHWMPLPAPPTAPERTVPAEESGLTNEQTK